MDVTVLELFMKLRDVVMIGMGHNTKVVALILPSSKMEDLKFTMGFCDDHNQYELHIIDMTRPGEGEREQHSIGEMTPFESMLDQDASEFWKKFGI